MKEREDIAKELANVAPGLPAGVREMPYSVPGHYFASFPAHMLETAKSLPADDVPAGYFDGFAAGMLQKVRHLSVYEELEQVAPLLNKADKTMPYSLPDGYFEQFTPILPNSKPTPARVVNIKRAGWKQWAAAAAILVTVGIGWQWLVNQPAEQGDITAVVTDKGLDTLLNRVDANSLTGYLETEEANSEFTGLLMLAQENVETSIKNLSTEDLKWYLENQDITEPGT